jgi:transcriptional regulator GlxA family with amidase domain
LLADTDMPIPQIAAAAGFNSREYLAHAFRQATGLTPREFRNRAQGR